MAKKQAESKTLSAERVTQYAKDVVDGKHVVCKHVLNTCQRHLQDLAHGKKRGLKFDLAAGSRAIDFIEKFIKLNGGKFEGLPFLLHPSQAFIVGSLFGWKKKDGFRRFRRAYIETGKGSGKSPLAAAIGLYGLIADGEARAEIYAAASKRDQAMVMFRDARAMVQLSSELSRVCEVTGGDHQPNIAFLQRMSFFRPISSEKAQSGPRPHMAICDEVHEHPSRDTMEMLERGFKFRQQPLLLMITNSGFDKNSVCWEEHFHAINVAAGSIQDDSSFSFVCGLDDGDDPLEDESCWVKANPLLGTTISYDYLRGVVDQAKKIPGKRNGILRLHFCVWTESNAAWMGRESWEACEVEDFDLDSLKNTPCFGGLDLSYKRDLTAYARVWPQKDGTYDAMVEFWTPGDTMRAREDSDRVPYRTWRDQGHIYTTPSATVDYAHVVPHLAATCENLEELAYDRWRIDLLKSELDEQGIDLPLKEFGQGFKDMAAAIDALESAILNKKLRVKFNPVLRWNVASAVIEQDPAGNRKFAKNKSTGRIDGVVALAMAMAIAQSHENVNIDAFIMEPLRT